DKLLGGMQRSDLIIIAARPAVGKSSLATTIACNASLKHNAVVAMFTLEMSSEQLVQRMISSNSGIDSKDLRTGHILDRWDEFTRVSGVLSEAQIFIDDSSSLTPMEIRSKSRRLAAEFNLDLIIIDYMQLMQAGDRRSENRVQEISYISRSLKALARELNVPVVALSQLSRAVENRPDKKPQLSDLRESGSIEQDADIVIFIYREDTYNEPTDRTNIADLIVAKHRHGASGTVSLYFNPKLTLFADLHASEDEGDGYGAS
ncbi:MAG: replicative DNA helicase, partial [Anaerolineae bacterium]